MAAHKHRAFSTPFPLCVSSAHFQAVAGAAIRDDQLR